MAVSILIYPAPALRGRRDECTLIAGHLLQGILPYVTITDEQGPPQRSLTSPTTNNSAHKGCQMTYSDVQERSRRPATRAAWHRLDSDVQARLRAELHKYDTTRLYWVAGMGMVLASAICAGLRRLSGRLRRCRGDRVPAEWRVMYQWCAGCRSE